MSYCCEDKFKLQEVGDSLQMLQGGSVTSVNGKVGAVVLDAGDIGYDGETIYPDESVGKELSEINSALSSLSSVTEIIDTASGAIASFPDGAGLPMRSLLAQIEPQQDLHGQDAPYPAGGGKNKFYSSTSNTATANGVTCSFDASTQTFTISGTNESSSAYILLSVIPTEDIVRNVALSRAFIGAPTGIYINLVYNDGGWHGLNNGDSLPDSVSIENVRIQVGVLGTVGSITTTTFKVQLEEGSTAPTAWTPYSNICPISGWQSLTGQRTGKNLLDDTQKETTTQNIRYYRENGITLKFGTYTLSSSQTAAGLYVKDSSDNSNLFVKYTNTALTFTLTEEKTVCFDCYYTPSVPSGTQVQLELGSTASTYEEYTGETISVSWQTEAGTVYGGTVDVVSGLLTVTDAIVDLGTFNYTYQSTYERFYAAISNMKSYTMPRSVAFLCSCFEAISDKREIDQVPYGAIYNGSGTNINIKIQGITDVTAFKNYVTGQTLVYKLAQPQTYHLTPQQISTLLGNNTVFVDTGDVEVTYQASIKGYIDKVLGA